MDYGANNFHLLRLFAALQVVMTHSATFLPVSFGFAGFLLRFFPGVPIFFIISGFLISASYEKNSHLSYYFRNRFLRIYPGLLVCTFFSLLSAGYAMGADHLPVDQVFPWLAKQLTFMQFVPASFLKDYGTGQINPSLWTITVELQFYLVVPILYFLIHKFRPGLVVKMVVLCLFILLSHYYYRNFSYFGQNGQMVFKLLWVSLLPHFYLFLIGMIVYQYFDKLKFLLVDKWIYWLLLFLVVSMVAFWLDLPYAGRHINALSVIPLAMLLISFAYSLSGLSWRLLGSKDISYGVYLYHMPLMNLFVALGLGMEMDGWIIYAASLWMIAHISWYVVEKPFLSYKRYLSASMIGTGNVY